MAAEAEKAVAAEAEQQVCIPMRLYGAMPLMGMLAIATAQEAS